MPRTQARETSTHRLQQNNSHASSGLAADEKLHALQQQLPDQCGAAHGLAGRLGTAFTHADQRGEDPGCAQPHHRRVFIYNTSTTFGSHISTIGPAVNFGDGCYFLYQLNNVPNALLRAAARATPAVVVSMAPAGFEQRLRWTFTVADLLQHRAGFWHHAGPDHHHGFRPGRAATGHDSDVREDQGELSRLDESA
jgi:hypothetical protein